MRAVNSVLLKNLLRTMAWVMASQIAPRNCSKKEAAPKRWDGGGRKCVLLVKGVCAGKH